MTGTCYLCGHRKKLTRHHIFHKRHRTYHKRPIEGRQGIAWICRACHDLVHLYVSSGVIPTREMIGK